MALGDKIGAEIPTHQFCAALQGWVRGTLSRSRVIATFNLDASDEDQLDQLKSVHDKKSTAVSKLEYIIWVERVLILLEDGKITRAQAKTFLEIT